MRRSRHGTPAHPRRSSQRSWPTSSGREGKKSVTDADRRRWQLPEEGSGSTGRCRSTPTRLAEGAAGRARRLPAGLAGQDGRGQRLHRRQRRAGGTGRPARGRPRRRPRVAGPSRSRRCSPPRMSLAEDSRAIGGAPEEAGRRSAAPSASGIDGRATNAEAYLDADAALLKRGRRPLPQQQADGVLAPRTALRGVPVRFLHAEGRWAPTARRMPTRRAGDGGGRPSGRSTGRSRRGRWRR